MNNSDLSCYPISLDEIKKKVERKPSRKKPICSQNLLFKNHSNVKQQKNEFGEEIIRVDGEIPVNLKVKDGSHFLFISYDQSTLSHGLHKYPAKFFPELPRWLIKRYSKENDIILDPFMGSGTTNIEALLCKRHSVGIDVDPFSRFLSKVKTTKLNKLFVKETSEEILDKLIKYKPSLVKQSDIPIFPYRDNWFNQEIILELAYIKKIILEIVNIQEIQDFYMICFSSIIRAVSNADDNCTRTVIRKKLNKKIYPSTALTKFAETVLINIPKMIEFSDIYPNSVNIDIPVDNDARNIKYPDNYFNLAITSPPYANAVDYPRTHQLEIYWLGLENGSLTHLKKMHVGTESVSSKEYIELHKIFIEDADNVISRIYQKDIRRAYIVFKYLEDMRLNLFEVKRVLKPEGRYIIVVGNNKIRNELFENWRYIKELAEQIGFEIENCFASEIIRHFIKVPREERINTDWILVLRKQGN